jgi:metallo-beta-lactamase family protein
MPTSVTFLGAARNVTGSRHLVDTGGARVLVDAGLYQEREHAPRNWDPFFVAPSTVDAVLLTHAHVDHTGWLPRLVRTGFSGPIYCSSATAEMLPLVRKRHAAEGRTGRYPVEPLYDLADVDETCRALRPLAFGQAADVATTLTATLLPTGHILGSSMVLLEDSSSGRRLLFSGDVGRRGRPLLPDPAAPPAADLLVVESTYGDRTHADTGDVATELAEVIGGAARAGGAVLIPCFAIERAQDLLFYLQQLRREARIPSLPIFLDSPMAVRMLDVFRHHPEALDGESRERLAHHDSPFALPELRLCVSRDESKRVNDVRGPCVIIAGSGMCTGGRIKHHLARHLEREEATLLFVGYQASGTLGRQLLDGAGAVRLFGQRVPVRLRTRQIGGFSGHADREELLAWIARMPGGPRRVAVVHGGGNVSTRFAGAVAERFGCRAEAPPYGARITLDDATVA